MTIEKINDQFFRSLPPAKHLLPYSTYRSIAKQTAVDLDSLFFYCIDMFRIEGIIECGANEASASIRANQLGLKALAIEANPSTFATVTPNPSDLFEKLNYGLSDKQSIQNFYIPKSNNTAGSATFYPKPGKAYRTVEVPTYTLDSVLSKYQITDRPYALWIDVEGMQKQVLRGALEALSNENCLIVKCEVEDFELFKNQGWLSEDICRYFSELGFDAIFRDFEYPYQYNVLFVKKPVSRSLYETRDRLISETWDEVKNSARFFALKIRLRAEFQNLLRVRIGKPSAAD